MPSLITHDSSADGGTPQVSETEACNQGTQDRRRTPTIRGTEYKDGSR